jgi:hypothetical protein
MFKPFTLIIFFLLNVSCNFSQEIKESPLEVELSLTKQYERTFGKNDFYFGLEHNGYEVTGDSLKQHFFDIKLTIKNNSKKSIYLWLMSCSWEDNFLINNEYMFFDIHGCNKNNPQRIEIKAGKSREYNTTIKKSIKFDNPCKGCIYGKQVETTKLGLIVINDPSKEEYIEYTTYVTDKSKWEIYWSNPLYLLTPNELNPTPMTIPVYNNH